MNEPQKSQPLTINSPMTVGMMAGQWCPHGLDPDQPGDQQLEEAGSLIFDTQALERELSILVLLASA